MVAALILLGEGLRLALMESSDMCAVPACSALYTAPIYLQSSPAALKTVATQLQLDDDCHVQEHGQLC